MGMLLVPAVIFALALILLHTFALTESTMALIIVYILGTTPGLMLSIRYPGRTAARLGIGFGYLVASAGLLFTESLIVGCWLTDICL